MACRTMLERLFLVAPFVCAASLAHAGVLSLDQALQEAGDGTAAANAELQARYAAKDQRQDEAGWEVFGSASTGRYNELVTQDVRDDYYGRSYAIGIRYPLLGTLRAKVDAVHSADRDARSTEIERGLQRAQQRLAVRSAYADWWRATQEAQLCKGVDNAAQQADRQVQERLAGKWILPSDAQLMHSEWTAVTRRCALQNDLLQDTRASLASLDIQVSPDDQPQAEPLAYHPQRLQAWQDLLDSHPRIAQRQADLNSAEADRQRPWYTAIDSYLTLGGSREERSDSSEAGSGLSAGITLSAPLDVMDYGSARSREGEARYQAASQALEKERGQLLRELGKVLEQQRRSVDEYVWRGERRSAIDGIINERRQRGSLDSGEASLRLLQAEVDRYNAGFAQISAWHGAWLQDSALRLFGDDSPAFAALLGSDLLRWQGAAPTETSGTATIAWSQGTYVWQSAPLLDATQRPAHLAALAKAGINTLNLGLDSVQIASLANTRTGLGALLDAAHGQGMRVNLLLGDPSWIKPRQRPLLITLLNNLHGLPFDGLHLDLEVEQLGWPVPDQRLREWLDTLRAAHQASPWPLSISSHPRWFNEEANRQPCVPCELPAAGVAEVSLMIYSRNPQRSAEQAIAIARHWPALHMRLAQSVEADQPADISWADASAAQLHKQVDAWRGVLLPANVSGIDWQSWTDYPRPR